MDPDLNKYDLNNRVTHHPVMSDEDWDDAYRAAWESFYSLEHVRTVLRRTAAHPRGRPHTTLTTLLWFKLMTMFEGVHPLEGGAFRRKSRRDRRDGLRLERPFVFYPRYTAEIALKAWHYWAVYRKARSILREVLTAPDRSTYTDLSITPAGEDEFDRLDLYHATAGGEGALAHKRREDRMRARVGQNRVHYDCEVIAIIAPVYCCVGCIQRKGRSPDHSAMHYTSHQGLYFAHLITLDGFGVDALAQSLSTARVHLNPPQVDVALSARYVLPLEGRLARGRGRPRQDDRGGPRRRPALGRAQAAYPAGRAGLAPQAMEPGVPRQVLAAVVDPQKQLL